MKVMVPLDGSEQSLSAMERGLAMLAGRHDVTLLCVQHGGFENAPKDIVEVFDDDEDDEIFPTRDSAERMLKAAATRIATAGHQVATKVVKGNVQKQVIAAAAGHDAIVMHALHRSGLRDRFKMSGTEAIARKVSCHVILVADDA